ncbi:MAG: diguanylate cyclase [Candidatus Dormibacteria bacterium]
MRSAGVRGLWLRLNFSVKFALIIAVTGVLIAIIPLSLSGRENSLQAANTAADKAGVVANLISGQERSLQSFAAGMATELAPLVRATDATQLAATLTRYSQVNGAGDIVGVRGTVLSAAVQGGIQLESTDPRLALGGTGGGGAGSLASGPDGAPWLVGTAAMSGVDETAFIARPVNAAFLQALTDTISSSANAAGIAIVDQNAVATDGSTLLRAPVAAGTRLADGLAPVLAATSGAQTVSVAGQEAGAAAVSLGGGYELLVTTPVSAVDGLLQPIALLLALIVVAMLCIVLVVQFDLQRPLRRLDRAVASMTDHDYDVPIPALGHAELGRLASSFEVMRRELRATVAGTHARAIIAGELNSPQPLETALQHVCAQLRSTTGADAALILVGGSEMTDSFAVTDGGVGHIDAPAMLSGDGPIGSTYRHGTPDALLVGAAPASLEHRVGIRELCAAPLHMGRTVLGVIGVSRQEGGFSAADASLVASAAEQVALALERYRFVAMVQRQASIDDLTGLYNHRFLVDYLGQQVALAERLNTPLAVLVIDLDHFKRVNDTYGHPVGDMVLHAFAECLTHSIRRADLAARYGGEEFIVVMSNTASADAAHVAEKIRATAEALQVHVDARTTIGITVSVGGAAYPEDTTTARELLATADAALYDAKHAGRNRVCMSSTRDGEQERHRNVTTVVRPRRRSAK